MKIKWNKESKLDYFGETKIIKQGEIGKAITKDYYPNQYLVEFQDIRFYAMKDHQFQFEKTDK